VSERDEIFRERLIAVMTDLNRDGGKDPALRRTVGNLALRLAKEARARAWSDIKERADGATYDSLLKLFQDYSSDASRNGDQTTVRAVELLGISLIARGRQQEDLKPGIEALDKFIADSASGVAKGPMHMPRRRTGAH
jgi:hypothetical protein